MTETGLSQWHHTQPSRTRCRPASVAKTRLCLSTSTCSIPSVKTISSSALVLSQTNQEMMVRSIASVGELGIHRLLEKYLMKSLVDKTQVAGACYHLARNLLADEPTGRWILSLRLRCSTSLKILIPWGKPFSW